MLLEIPCLSEMSWVVLFVANSGAAQQGKGTVQCHFMTGSLSQPCGPAAVPVSWLHGGMYIRARPFGC
jgi:hypothetical protein